jgi:hypothetical protein
LYLCNPFEKNEALLGLKVEKKAKKNFKKMRLKFGRKKKGFTFATPNERKRKAG